MTYNPFSLENKTILITGASSGIGKATAIECSKSGAKLVITGRNPDRLSDTLSLLSGEDHQAICTDLSTPTGIDALISSLPKLDGIVLAAGIVESWPVLFATKERFNKTFDTNLFSPVEIIRLIIKKKLYNPNLSIVAIDSIAGSSDFCPANSIYGAGKAALKAFMKYTATEMASKKIRANTISPGMILTPMQTKGKIEEEKLLETIDKVPLKRWGDPEDIAYGVIYLLSDASSYVTGTDICIDGGYSI